MLRNCDPIQLVESSPSIGLHQVWARVLKFCVNFEYLKLMESIFFAYQRVRLFFSVFEIFRTCACIHVCSGIMTD